MTLPDGFYVYPPPNTPEEIRFGVLPIDFILETVLRAGIEWFKTDAGAPNRVYGHLLAPYLSTRYGQAKIDEIADYIKAFDLKVVQGFAGIDQHVPCLSIQIADSSEMTERAGMADFRANMDAYDAELNVTGRNEVGYSPITDTVHIGIHNTETPDLTKYLYYLVVYILSAFKPTLESRGIHLGTFRATDLSRLNDYLPDHVYSRFINFSVFSIANFDKGDVPIIEQIIGVHVEEGVHPE